MPSTALARAGDITYRARIMSEATPRSRDPFATLNDAQRAAVEYGMEAMRAGEPPGPLLVIAGAGSGKTRTLTARVANLILNGADPRRILLLTFTRRAAREMTRRAQALIADATASDSTGETELDWSGTFHATGQRLLRLHARQLGLSPDFTVLDRSDAEDLIDIVRNDLELGQSGRRFPRKGACLSIYSLAVNARLPLEQVLKRQFPQYADYADDLKRLFAGYVDAKQQRDLLDYDDLLLYWAEALRAPQVAEDMRRRFDHILVDEYQDTNAVQEDILLGLAPSGAGLTAVGDDAQSIYAFRAATIENILQFPSRFARAVEVVRLEENYRSTQPILAAANAVIARSPRRYEKELYSQRTGGGKPRIVTVEDDRAQVDYIVREILARREEAVDLKRQAVLMRAGWHSGSLEIELTRRNIPFVKYGGLKFLEAAHVKDTVAVLRWAENPRDQVAAFRALQILPGIGPGNARRALVEVERCGPLGDALRRFRAPANAREEVAALAELMTALTDARTDWSAQPNLARRWYARHLERLYDNPQPRERDLEQFERIAQTYPNRGRFLSEVALDPPEVTSDEAGPPLIDDDYLILSTIHSAKGQEYHAVYLMNVVDGCIPSDMATGSAEEIEEERRLLYVGMTRARDHLHLLVPHRFYRTGQRRHGDAWVTAVVSRFLPESINDHFERCAEGGVGAETESTAKGATVDLKSTMRDMWR